MPDSFVAFLVTAPAAGYIAIVPAAGSGVRLAAQRPKALCELAGVPLLRRTVDTLLSTQLFSHLLIAVPDGSQSEFEAVLPANDSVRLVVGGAERRESVWRALQFARQHCAPTEKTLVAVHDAARCLVSAECVRRVVRVAEGSGAATAAVPCVDSLCLGTNNREPLYAQSVPRDGMWSIQTPQVFWFELLWKAHQESVLNATDDASLVARVHEVSLVMGERRNMKITTPEDLKLAVAFLTEIGSW
ncbi:MAG: 2-C-methyl-D-erythritol 4-phosphate cytidylyltransferase [Oligoflexia bacterium]|nr:2-C-methyl-D-erythritol 4-phosphate cytidylyltransferase [Oligoflexia bacterium]